MKRFLLSVVVGLCVGCGMARASVKVSSFGFDAEDATEIVQRALDSGTRTLLLDRQAGPWTIRPVFVRSDTELVFEEGVELVAKKGAYRDEWDSLITAQNVTNVVFRGLGRGATLSMRREDYGKAPYMFSEHRHIFNLLGTANVTIENLRIAESGGDGIYVGAGKGGEPCRNTVIRRCDCDRNHRQGVSVITANGLLIEDSKLRNTIGTAPKAGIDFEPNGSRQELVDCTLRNCEITGNDGHGVDVYLGQLRAATKPVSIRVEGCRIADNARFARFSGGFHANPDDAVGGTLTFSNCIFSAGGRKDAAFSVEKPAHAYRAVLSDCEIVEPAGNGGYRLFPLAADFDRPLPDGFTLANVTIRQPQARAWAAAVQENWCAKRPVDWTGHVTVVTPDGTRTETLDAAWCAKAFPAPAGEPIGPLVKGDFAKAAVEDARPGEMSAASTLGFRGKARFVFYAAKGTAHFRMRYERMKDYPNRAPKGTVALCAVGDAKPVRTVATLSHDVPEVAFSVEVPKPGFWALLANITEQAKLTVVAADVPLAVDCTGGPQQFIYSTGEASFFVPTGARVETFCAADPGEYVGLTLTDACGRTRMTKSAFGGGVERFTSEGPAATDGFWSVRFDEPTRGGLRKYFFHVRRVPGYLFLTPGRRWRFASGRVRIPLSGEGWTCDGAAVTVPHTWNAVDGADGLGPKSEGSAGAVSYLRKAATYARALPDPTPGRRSFLRCEAVSQKATVRVNGRDVGRHEGAFTAFCFDVTDFLKPTGNVLEVVADNRIDKDIPPIEADFTLFGGIYRDVWLIETEALYIDPTVDGAPGVEIAADPDSGEVAVSARVKGAASWRTTCTVEGPGLERPLVSEATRFMVPGFRRWSPETPNVYRLTVTVAANGLSDSVTLPFGFRKIEFRKDGFYLNGVRRQMHGVNYHQDREGKGWAITRDAIREDMSLIRDLGADSIRTAHYPHSDYCYDRCDAEGLLAWVEAPNVNRIRFTEGYVRNARSLVREMIAQLKHHPSVFTWSTSNEINFRASEKEAGVTSPERSAAFMSELKELANACDPSRPDSTATFREHQVAENRVPTLIGFNIYPGWYRNTPDSATWTVDRILKANPSFTTLAVTEYGAGASVFHHADVLSRGGSSEGKPGPANWHPEEYQAWVHYRNYRSLVADGRVWGTFVWLMFDFAADVVNEGWPFGQNDKGLMAYDHKTKKDAYWFYRANWRSGEPLLHLVGKRLDGLYGETATVLGFSTVGDVTLRVNGKAVGTQTPDAVKAVCWRDVPLAAGENVIELTAGGRTEKAVWKLY